MLSFVVTVYRAWAYLPRCVDSILSQTREDIELILVDDGSPDRCPKLCDRYADLDPRVQVIHQKYGGLVRARNRGIEAARGEYVCLVDGGDTVSPHLAERLAAVRDAAPQPPDLMLFGYRIHDRDRDEEAPPRFAAGYYDRQAMRREILPYFISDRRSAWWEPGVPLPLFCKAIRREYLLAHRFTDETAVLGADAAQSFECLFFAKSLAVCGELLYECDRTRPDFAARRARKDPLDHFARLYTHLRAAIGGNSLSVDRQMNDYFADQVLRVVHREAEQDAPVLEVSRRLREDFRRTGLLERLDPEPLPMQPRTELVLLRLGWVTPVLLALRAERARKTRRNAAPRWQGPFIRREAPPQPLPPRHATGIADPR